MTNPFISIIMPNYNHGKYLSESIHSVLNQTFKDYELIIIDDASSDNSLDIINEFQRKNANIKLITNRKNQGLITNVNKAIGLSKGKYLTFFAADDLMFKSFLEETTSLALKHPKLGIICGNSCEFENKKPYNFKLRDCGFEAKNYVFSSTDLVKILKTTKFWIPSHASIYKKQAVIKCHCYQNNLKSICDWFLNYKIAFTYGVGYIPKSFGAVRIVKTSYAHTYMSQKKTRDEMYMHLLRLLSLEKPIIQRAFQKSSLIGEFGLRMIEYILKKPTHWSYLPSLLSKIPAMVKKKFQKLILK